MARDYRTTQAQASRQRIAVEAARIMRESGIDDAASARRRAARRLAVHDPHALPELDEIMAALHAEQRLYAGVQHAQHQQYLRAAACEAMAFFSAFDARAVGCVLDGSAERHSAVCLQVFADDPESVIHFLHEHAIAHDRKTRCVRLNRERTIQANLLAFTANAVAFELILLPRSALRQAPLAPAGDTAMARATLSQLRALLAGA